jgi:hypothetical protein
MECKRVVVPLHTGELWEWQWSRLEATRWVSQRALRGHIRWGGKMGWSAKSDALREGQALLGPPWWPS